MIVPNEDFNIFKTNDSSALPLYNPRPVPFHFTKTWKWNNFDQVHALIIHYLKMTSEGLKLYNMQNKLMHPSNWKQGIKQPHMNQRIHRNSDSYAWHTNPSAFSHGCQKEFSFQLIEKKYILKWGYLTSHPSFKGKTHPPAPTNIHLIFPIISTPSLSVLMSLNMGAFNSFLTKSIFLVESVRSV